MKRALINRLERLEAKSSVKKDTVDLKDIFDSALARSKERTKGFEEKVQKEFYRLSLEWAINLATQPSFRFDKQSAWNEFDIVWNEAVQKFGHWPINDDKNFRVSMKDFFDKRTKLYIEKMIAKEKEERRARILRARQL